MDATSGANALIVNDSRFRGRQLTIPYNQRLEDIFVGIKVLSDNDNTKNKVFKALNYCA